MTVDFALHPQNTTIVSRALQRARIAVANGVVPRKDDNFLTMQHRIAEYEKNLGPTLHALRQYMRIGHIDGEEAQVIVANAICHVLAKGVETDVGLLANSSSGLDPRQVGVNCLNVSSAMYGGQARVQATAL